MDPRYRSYNLRDSTPRFPHAISSSYYFSTLQAYGAGHMEPEFRQLQYGYIRDDHRLNLHHHHHHPYSRLQGMNEIIRKEIEKERIREDIIMAEIVRRRVLEEEVRREKMMMEREMALRRGSDAFPYHSSTVMKLESPVRSSFLGTRAEGWSAGERLGVTLENKEKQRGRHGNGGFFVSLFQRTANVQISEVTPALEGHNKKERILLLTKPHENVSGSKRKLTTPPEELPADIIANKRAKEEWSCALCQISTSGEKALEEHVLGKKHKLKEAALKAQRGGKNYSIGIFPSKATKSNHAVGIIDPGGKEGVTDKAKSLLSEKAGEAKSKKDGLPLLESQKSEHLMKAQSEVIRRLQKNEDDPKYKFWCEICRVRTLTNKVMNRHKKGKKHLRRLRSCEQNGGTSSVNQKKSAAAPTDCMVAEKFNQAWDQSSSDDHVSL